MNDQPLPNALSAEGVIISTCIQYGLKAVDACAGAGLVETDFYNTDNGKVYRTLLLMRSFQKPVDLELIRDELKQNKVFDEEKCTEYPCNIIDISPCVIENIPAHCKVIKEAARKRQIIESCSSVAETALTGEVDSENLLKTLDEKVLQINIDKKGFPSPVSGEFYNRVGIPDRKPELIGGVLRRSHKMLIGAPSKGCKSFLAIRLALSIATGWDWLGFPCTKGNVYFINFEVDDGSFMHRVKAIAEALQITPPDNILYHHLRGECSNIEVLFPALARECEGKDFSAIIFDPQYKLLRSSKITFSENDSAAMAYLYGELDRNFAQINISPIVISHFAKGSASGKEQIDRIAGSGLLARDVDALFTLTALVTDDCYRGEFAVREFKAPEPISLQWVYPLHQINPELDTVGLKRPGRPQGVSTIADDALVLKTVQGLNGEATQSAVRASLAGQMSKERVIDALQRLVNDKKTRPETRGRNHAIYYQIL